MSIFSRLISQLGDFVATPRWTKAKSATTPASDANCRSLGRIRASEGMKQWPDGRT